MSNGVCKWGLAAAILWLCAASAKEIPVDTLLLSESSNDQIARSQSIHLKPASQRTYLIRFDEPALPARLPRAGSHPDRKLRPPGQPAAEVAVKSGIAAS